MSKNGYPQFVIYSIFTDVNRIMTMGIFMSGEEEKGIYKRWFPDGQLQIHLWYNKKHQPQGQRKEWINGNLYTHWYDNSGRVTAAPESAKFKKGYLLDSEGHYHKD